MPRSAIAGASSSWITAADELLAEGLVLIQGAVGEGRLFEDPVEQLGLDDDRARCVDGSAHGHLDSVVVAVAVGVGTFAVDPLLFVFEREAGEQASRGKFVTAREGHHVCSAAR